MRSIGHLFAESRRGKNPLPRTLPPAAPFLSAAKEREERKPPKPMVLDSLRGRGAVQSETHLPHESNNAYPRCAFASPLRLSPFESAYALALACRSQDPYSLLAFRRGRCLHRPAWICPALLAARHCEPVTDVTGVAIRISRPSGSPFKGSCHGKAVTEGSTRHFSRRASVGADAHISPPCARPWPPLKSPPDAPRCTQCLPLSGRR